MVAPPLNPAKKNKPYVGRLAPSPTGFLHAGNAFAFWMAWLDARAAGGKRILRMEDIDPERSREEFAQGIRKDLQWLGLDWDEETPPQSSRTEAYEKAIETLAGKGKVYPCFCSRKELRQMAAAPHVGDAGAPYPGTCRNLPLEERKALEAAGKKASLRLDTSGAGKNVWTVDDAVCGRTDLSLEESGGDFILKRSDGVFAYQLAVVVDDMESGVTDVIRGMDILPATARQLYLYALLEGEAPDYAHLPLVVDRDGERLAKRHGSLTLAALRENGVRPENLLGLLAKLAGLRDTDAPVKAGELVRGFKLSALRREPLVLDTTALPGR